MKNEIVILTIILIISTVFGCINTAQPKKDPKVYGSDYVNFQMPEGWEVHPLPGEGTVIWMKGDPRIRVIEQDKQKFDSDYNKALNTDKGSYIVKTGNEAINGIEVNIIMTTKSNNGDIQDEYFFGKNNKYYQLVSWAFTGWDSKKQVSSRKEIDKALNTIVTTIN